MLILTIKPNNDDTFIMQNNSINKVSNYQLIKSWIIWSCVAGFYLYEMILRIAPSTMTEDLMCTFSISATGIGILSSSYHYAYVALQVPCGIIVDRYGIRKVIVISAFACSVGSFIFSYTNQYYLVIFSQILIGSGSACAFLSTLKVGSDCFPSSYFAMLSSLTNLMGIFGATFGNKPIAILINTYGWRLTLKLASMVGLLISVMSFYLIKDINHQNDIKKKEKSLSSFLKEIKVLLYNRQLWLIGFMGGLTYIPIASFAGLWSTPFLMSTYNVENTTASTASIMIFFGVGIGSPFSIFLSDFLKSRLKTIAIMTTLALIIFLFIIFYPSIPIDYMFFLSFLAGFFIGGQILCFTCIKESVNFKLNGTAIGIINAIVMFISAAVIQPIFGYLLDFVWDGKVNKMGNPLYSYQNFQIALLIIPVCLFIGIGLLLFIKETYSNK